MWGNHDGVLNTIFLGDFLINVLISPVQCVPLPVTPLHFPALTP